MPVSAPSVPQQAARLDVAADLLALLHDTATEPRPDTQLEALTLAVAADPPVLLWGEPGIGKTAALTQLAAALDLPSLAARSLRSPRSPERSAAAGTWSPLCRATRRQGWCAHCVGPRESNWWVAAGRTCASASPPRCGPGPGRTSSWY